MAAIDAESVAEMRRAIRKRDLPSFMRVLDEKRPLWTSGYRLFMESRRLKRGVTLLQKLATCEYDEALRYYLQRCWPTISSAEANTTLYWVLLRGTAKPIMRTLLEAAMANAPNFLSARRIYDHALEQRLYDIAERAVQRPDFEPNARSRMPIVGIGLRWDLPIHDAVTHHQVTIIEMLVARGAHVDALSDTRISPMMVACHLIYPNVVVQLLRHGSNPNFPPVTPYTCRMTLRRLTMKLGAERGAAANNAQNPVQPTTNNRSRALTEKADYILQLLIEAGLRHSTKRFLQHSTVKRHLSPEMSRRLKHLSREVRSLKTIALVKIRDLVRHQCKGVRFFDAVNGLPIPDSVKKQITFRVRP